MSDKANHYEAKEGWAQRVIHVFKNLSTKYADGTSIVASILATTSNETSTISTLVESPPSPPAAPQIAMREAGIVDSKGMDVTRAAAALGVRMLMNTRSHVFQAASEDSDVSEALNNLVVAYVIADWASVAELVGSAEQYLETHAPQPE